VATIWSVKMISIPKLVLIGIIICGVWMLFRIIDRRRLNAANSEKAENTGGPVDTVECPDCKSFVSEMGCSKPDCPVRQN